MKGDFEMASLFGRIRGLMLEDEEYENDDYNEYDEEEEAQRTPRNSNSSNKSKRSNVYPIDTRKKLEKRNR